VEELTDFGGIVLVVGVGFLLAILASKVTERFPLPAPALFLLAAALAATDFESLGNVLSVRDVERIGVVALVVILFDGGMHVSWRRFRRVAVPVTLLGVLGTFATAGLMAVAAHYLFGFSWTAAGILGAALAPTDPAVMFSVLGNREVRGRSGTILEGESGANDPVGIALMIGMLELATEEDATFWVVVEEFALEMVVGLAIGLLGAVLLIRLIQRISLPSEGLYPLRTLAAALVIYGIATVAHGSGFLAVFVAGLLVSDIRAPYKGEIERFHTALASLGEIVVFVALGLTITLDDIGLDEFLDGLLLAVILALVARPVAVGLLLLPVRLRWGERLFVMWGGLKGAVPILLAAFALLAGIDDGRRIYEIVFVVVAFSVIVQGSSIPYVAGKLRVRMRAIEPEPWNISIGLRKEPGGVWRFELVRGARAEGMLIRDLPIGERAWIILVVRGGEAVRAGGSTRLEAGDEVLVLIEERDTAPLRRLFERSSVRVPEESEPGLPPE
jgi:cell volume regulation protein A